MMSPMFVPLCEGHTGTKHILNTFLFYIICKIFCKSFTQVPVLCLYVKSLPKVIMVYISMKLESY